MTQAGILGDPRFFNRAGPFSLARVASEAGAALSKNERVLTGIASLQRAEPDQVSFMHNRRYLAALRSTRAGAVVVAADLASEVPPTTATIVVADPQAAWARIAALFHPASPPVPGIHPTAAIDPSAKIDPSAEIGPCSVIGAMAQIGAHCRIEAGAVVGSGVIMGECCRIGLLASVTHAILGRHVYLYPGARVGQEGYGFAVTPEGFLSVPQLGRVILHDGVEIGANACVDRGAAQDTVIGPGTRLDNLVQIAHNVSVGAGCVIVAQAGVAGSAIVEDYVTIAGQVGVNGHIRVGTRARIGPQAGVISDVPPGSELIGSPALPVREFFRNVAALRKLARKNTADKKSEVDGQHHP